MAHRILFVFGLIFGTFWGSPSIYANVSLKNGNFFIGYTDIVYPGGIELKIERVNNSKTPFKGMFGWGWGSAFETKLTVAADGTVRVEEYGGGAQNLFSPVSFNEAELEKAVSMISGAAQKAGLAGSAEQLASYKKKLKSDALFRNDEWAKFLAQGKVEARRLPVGSQLKSNRFNYQYITRVADGYVRTSDNGNTEKFNEAGRLVKISDKNGNFITLEYRESKFTSYFPAPFEFLINEAVASLTETISPLVKLLDNFNRKMYLNYNNRGLLSKIDGENSKKAVYDYNNSDELVKSTDVDGNTYTYKYDKEGRHNMVEIGYSDHTTMAMTYFDQKKHENIKSVKDRDGTLTEYDYVLDPSDKGHYTVVANIKDSNRKAISNSKYEYFIKNKSSGEEWTYRLITAIEGDKTETTYNECCGLPLIIKHNGDTVAFDYDVKGHVRKKDTPTETTLLEYDTKAGKIQKVTRFSKLDKKSVDWSTFRYDAKGNLVLAKNSSGKGVQLLYDSNGRIRTMIDLAGSNNKKLRQVNFKYNENSKPVEITDPSLGTINVAYKNSGEIDKVDSTAGRKIALQVTSAFQDLLDIIRPAGVTLAF